MFIRKKVRKLIKGLIKLYAAFGFKPTAIDAFASNKLKNISFCIFFYKNDYSNKINCNNQNKIIHMY